MLSLENFLDKDDKRKFDFLRLLEESSELSELNATIQSELSLSNFLFSKTVEELGQDFDRYDLTRYFAIDNDNVRTTLYEAGQATSDLLLAEYLRHSLAFSILMALFEETFQSTQSFADDNFTSYTSVYGRLRQIKQLLQTFDVILDKHHHLVGPEPTIRYLLTRIFAFVLVNDHAMYPETVQNQASDSLAKLEPLNINLPQTVAIKLFHFLCIAMTRAQQGHALSADDPNRQKVMTALQQAYPDAVAVIERVPSSDLFHQELLAFLYVSDLLPSSQSPMALGKHLSQLNDRFMAAAQATFDLPETAKTLLDAELTRLHFELIYFPLNAYYSFEHFDVTFFKESYIEYFECTRQYLMDEAFLESEGILKFRAYIFYRYLMILISRVHLASVTPPITVCVDFSYGQEYNDFIKKNFALFVNLNVNVQFAYDETTDIVVTNLNAVYDDLDVEKVIWLDPPRAIDWAHLSDRILEIRAAKAG
ncbi:helix-turn-helix domain-containing protein [Lacticaseibacillus brantae]|uniref:Mga helix-turn-helix domain-containing protein n=1 Tax=Lacticaseibacillus brantae DSM 23927 TaxID=1423727 RepID=A0A0R2AX38_9LACO|nr:helix-turn-helix domain-containing protein [Lacticaseibacillus brantae]KRM71258.1 hypothetical protein FC34_GL001736 [Lacticaseibacillus brantae DSM 23927]